MAILYTPVSQRSSSPDHSRSIGDLESHGDRDHAKKPLQLTLPQRQLVGVLVFVWLLCLWVWLKVLEANAAQRSPLLLSTNVLLNTTDLYHTLTLPLLRLTNRTKLISTRCGSTTLAPHLLTFLSNDLYDLSQQTPPPPPADGESPIITQAHRRPSRYLIAVVLQDSETVLPDLLSRILEVIAVLGPNNCHLSIVDRASTDKTRETLRFLSRFLDDYNEENTQSLDGYTLGRIPRDNSLKQTTGTRNMALRALLDRGSEELFDEEVVRNKAVAEEQTEHGEVKESFDEVILLDPVVTCAEDILELIFQSRLQNADLTCGMDIGHTVRLQESDSVETEKTLEQGDYQSVGQCNQTDDRVKLIQYLRQSSSAFESYSPRVIVVPSIPFPYSSKDYVNQGRFNGWGLWPKTEKQYRDQLESKLEAESRHPLYGYRPSTASYGYILRVKKDGDQDPFVEGMEKDEKSSEADVEKWGAESLVVSEEVTVALKTKLEEIGAAFGVQDIQNAVILKTEGEMIGKWRERSASSAWEC
ncbi:capsular associated protein [Gamsiella multidivaricata]|nr:capsular associated protein [Gamsiella multidivaricata]